MEYAPTTVLVYRLSALFVVTFDLSERTAVMAVFLF